jgi:hypothetical protein
MKTQAQCAADARAQHLRGANRKAFMRDCRAAISAQCRAQARAQGVPRYARRDFMRGCINGQPPR